MERKRENKKEVTHTTRIRSKTRIQEKTGQQYCHMKYQPGSVSDNVVHM